MSENKQEYQVNRFCLQLAAILQRILNGKPTQTDEEEHHD